MAEIPVVDVHAHLTDPQFDQDIEDVISRAQQAGVCAVLAVSESKADFAKVLDLADRYPSFVVPCLGLHPVQHAGQEDDGQIAQRSVKAQDLDEVADLLEEHCHKLAAIGEVGLDFTPRWCGTLEDKTAQKEVLIRQTQLALKYDLPLNVHSRSAGIHAINLLKEQGATKVVLHAFDGKPSSALKGVECGYYFSVPPSISRSPQTQKLVSAIPLSHLLLETDSPCLGAGKGVRNEPANIRISCEWIAQIKNISAQEVREVTTQNAVKLFPALAKLIRI